ncbi:MAG: ATP-binding protein [Cytophagaceae bacterium]
MKVRFPELSAVRKLIIGLVVTAVISSASLYYSYKASHELFGNLGWLENAYDANFALESVLLEMTRCESNVRAYVITGNKSILEDYNISVKALEEKLDELEKLTVEDPNFDYTTLKDLVKRRISILDNTLQSYQGLSTDPEIIQKVTMGKEFSEKVFELKEQMEKSVRENMNRRHEIAYGGLNKTNQSILLAGIVSLIILSLVVVIISKDITHRMKLEKELRILDENKNRFFSIISHDLRGPVHGISKLAEFLKDSENLSKDESSEMVKMISKTAVQVSNLLENLLTWAKMQMKSFDIRREVFNINECVKRVISVLGNAAELKNISVTNEMPDVSVNADKNMIELIIRNLVSNSLKYTDKGGKIWIRGAIQNQMLKVEITDTGIGIPENIMEGLFKINAIQSRKGTDSEKGSGLGLLLCKDFVEVNGGTIEVKSQKGKGSSFYFTVSLEDSASRQ